MALQQIVEQTVTGLGYELIEIERLAGGLLRVTIDWPWVAPAQDAPLSEPRFVTVEDCETVTRQLLFALEVDAIEYSRLEVSSPGIDRLLRNAQDFERLRQRWVRSMRIARNFAARSSVVPQSRVESGNGSWSGAIRRRPSRVSGSAKTGRRRRCMRWVFRSTRYVRRDWRRW